ncbi:UBX protein, partial [Acromyrmex heyeri]
MNSYFEQTAGGFYGSHHHQTGAASQHHDPATAAAYRSFPLGLGMSPYASAQHHHHTSSSLGIHPGGGSNTRPPQDSPYDASVATACKLYSTTPEATGHTTSSYSTTATKDCKQQDQTSTHQNGYAAVMAAAAVKDVWQSATSGANSQSNSVVRPSACTPESTRVSSYGGLVGGDPASSPGNNSSSRSLTSSWNTCSLNSSASQPVATQLHQQPTSNHTFYPWMAIADFDQKRTIIVHTSFMHVNHCNSCLLIISASISRSKPPANADRTLSLSWSPHFAPLYCSTSAKTPSSFSSTPSDSSICAWCVQELPTVTPAELVSDRAYAFQSYTGNA